MYPLRLLHNLFFRHARSYEPVDTSPESNRRRLRSPSPSRHHSRPTSRSKRPLIITVLCAPLLGIVATAVAYHLFFRIRIVDEALYGEAILPSYEEFLKIEERLPQHNKSLPFPEGLHGRFLKFSNQAWGYGLNNQLQEILLLSHIAYRSGRSYVFQPYTWDAKTDSLAVLDGKHWRSSRIPLTAFISGPTAGGPFAHEDPSPRAVSVRWWEEVCPEHSRKIIDVKVENQVYGFNSTTEGGTLLDYWINRLSALDAHCVEVTGPVIFNFELIASPRILSIWPSLSTSPILGRFAWSSLISSAVQANLPLLFHTPSSAPSQPAPPMLPDQIKPTSSADSPSPASSARPDHPLPVPPSFNYQSNTDAASFNSSDTIPGLIAIHLRRGDFKVHCHWLADRSEPFAGWNQFPYLADRFTPPESATSPLGRGKVHAAYVKRCWPEIPQIVERLDEARRSHPGLTRVFVLTNGPREWLSELRDALQNPSAGYVSRRSLSGRAPVPHRGGFVPWASVITSRDLVIAPEQKEVDQAVDMEIARRAEYFIGNGFSSLTSNIVMLRLSDSTSVDTIRFW